MFLFSVIGLSLGTYLISSSMGVKENTNDVNEINDGCEVVGKFSIQAQFMGQVVDIKKRESGFVQKASLSS